MGWVSYGEVVLYWALVEQARHNTCQTSINPINQLDKHETTTVGSHTELIKCASQLQHDVANRGPFVFLHISYNGPIYRACVFCGVLSVEVCFFVPTFKKSKVPCLP